MVVDLAPLAAGESAGHAAVRAGVMAELGRRGLVEVTGHGMPADLHAAAFDQMRAFYALPEAERVRLRRAPEHLPRGWHPLPETGDHRERFFCTFGLDAPDSPFAGEERWPPLPGFAETMHAWMHEAHAIGQRLLACVALALGLPEGHFAPLFEPPHGGGALWLMHYPPAATAGPQRPWGTTAHTDLHPLTLLAQDDVGGLEWRDRDGGWHPLEPAPDRLIAQIGDVMARWTDDRLRPFVHRVRNDPSRSRYSMGYFLQPRTDAWVAPLPGVLTDGHPPRRSPAPFGAVLAQWLQAVAAAPHLYGELEP